MAKISDVALSMMKLIHKSGDAGRDGWASVSDAVWPTLDWIPEELIEKHRWAKADGVLVGEVRLTDKGKLIIKYMG